MSAPMSPCRTRKRRLTWSQPDDRARAVGAANTLWLDGVLRSTNTDVEGFLDNLDACAPGWDRDLAKAVVLGGRRRGARGGLCAPGTRHRARRGRQSDARAAPRPCANDSARAFIPPLGTSAMPRSTMRRSLVNTTTLGMAGQPELALEIGRLPSHAIVADLVYCAAGDAAPARGAGARTAHRRRPWHADASGRAAALCCGSAKSPK